MSNTHKQRDVFFPEWDDVPSYWRLRMRLRRYYRKGHKFLSDPPFSVEDELRKLSRMGGQL